MEEHQLKQVENKFRAAIGGDIVDLNLFLTELNSIQKSQTFSHPQWREKKPQTNKKPQNKNKNQVYSQGVILVKIRDSTLFHILC